MTSALVYSCTTAATSPDEGEGIRARLWVVLHGLRVVVLHLLLPDALRDLRLDLRDAGTGTVWATAIVDTSNCTLMSAQIHNVVVNQQSSTPHSLKRTGMI